MREGGERAVLSAESNVYRHSAGLHCMKRWSKRGFHSRDPLSQGIEIKNKPSLRTFGGTLGRYLELWVLFGRVHIEGVFQGDLVVAQTVQS